MKCWCENGMLPERGLVVQVQCITLVIGKDEGKHRVLHKIIERSTGLLVQFSQVFEVSYTAVLPSTKRRLRLPI